MRLDWQILPIFHSEISVAMGLGLETWGNKSTKKFCPIWEDDKTQLIGCTLPYVVFKIELKSC